MSRDIRVPLNDIPVTGINERIDNQINQRFESVMRAIMQLQARTLLEPRSIPPYKPYDGQVELADGVGWDPLGLGGEYLCYYWQGEWRSILDDRHLDITPPDYIEDPHQQYWHKVLDPAWMHLHFEDFNTPKTVTNGQIITNYTGNIVSDWQLTSDPVAGTVVISDTGLKPQTGVYHFSVSGYLAAEKNSSYVITMYRDGAPTVLRCPMVFGANTEDSSFVFSGVGYTDTPCTLDLRLEVGASVNISTIFWSMHRVSPIAGTPGIEISGDLTAPPLPPDWNAHGGQP